MAAVCLTLGLVVAPRVLALRQPGPPAVQMSAVPVRRVQLTTVATLRRAVARIPGYRAHRPARWLVSRHYPDWGATDWYNNTIYISPSVPPGYLNSVVRHEWSHILSARVYGGDIDAALRAMNRTFGGGGPTRVRGAEYAADCMAIRLGATWTHYTRCHPLRWRDAAARLLRGQRLR